MLLLNTNHKCIAASRFVSLCVVASMFISAFCFPCITDNLVEDDKGIIPSETGEIDKFASDCVITIVRTTGGDETDNTSSDETDTDNEKADESSAEGVTDETSPVDPEGFDYLLESEAVVTKIAFEKTDTITTREDDKAIIGHIKVDVTDVESFDLSGVSFLSEDPTVAKINFDYCRGLEDLYYKLIPVSGGETQIYAQTEDGTICSEHIKVVVKKNEVEAIDLEKSVTTCSL